MSQLVIPSKNDLIIDSSKPPEEILVPDTANELPKRSFKDFIKRVFPGYCFNWHHEIIIETLERFYDPDSGLDRLIIQSPPRTGKTELIKLFLSWTLGKNPDAKCVYTSYGAELSQKANRDVQRYIDNEKYYEIFPFTQLNSTNVKTDARGNYIRTANEFEIVGHTGGLKTVGVGGALTGSGADCFIGSTRVAHGTGESPIEKIYENPTKYRVKTYDTETGWNHFRKVVAVQRKKTNKRLFRVTTSSGTSFTCTEDHPIYKPLKNKYEEARLLNPRDLLLHQGSAMVGHYVSVSSVEDLGQTDEYVYDIEVEGEHNFYAEGILSHNCGIIDDVLKDWQEATSPVRRQMILDWFESTFYTRLSKKGKVLMNMTRWHEDDLIGEILKRMETKNDHSDQYEVISFPMVYEESRYAHPEDFREPGEPLWEEFFPLEKCKKIKATVGSRKWGSLYQQRPSPDEGDLVQRSWWNFYAIEPEELDLDYYSISWDFTFKDGKKSDYVVGQVWGKKGAQYYLMDQVRDKMNFSSAVQAIKSLAAKWPEYREIIVEEKANGAAIIDTVKKTVRGIIPYNPKESKTARASSITPLIEAGNVYLPDPLIRNWVSDYIEEWAVYPGANDDQIDATSQCLIRFKNNMGWLDENYQDQDDAPKDRESIVMDMIKRNTKSALDF